MSHQVHMYCRWLQYQAVVPPDAVLLLVERSVVVRVCPSTTAIYQRQTSLSNILAVIVVMVSDRQHAGAFGFFCSLFHSLLDCPCVVLAAQVKRLCEEGPVVVAQV